MRIPFGGGADFPPRHVRKTHVATLPQKASVDREILAVREGEVDWSSNDKVQKRLLNRTNSNWWGKVTQVDGLIQAAARSQYVRIPLHLFRKCSKWSTIRTKQTWTYAPCSLSEAHLPVAAFAKTTEHLAFSVHDPTANKQERGFHAIKEFRKEPNDGLLCL